MTTLVKICGITSLDDALDAVECGADFLGFNFYPDSPRFIDPDEAKMIFEDIPSNITKVGIFVNADADAVIDIAVDLNLDILQFHGDETPEYCNAIGRPWIKALRPQTSDDLKILKNYESDSFLIDAYVEKAFGGTGVVSNWDLAREAKQYGQLFLSGGLNPDNVELAVNSVKPFAVDVASGVESSPGVKDRSKMELFVARAKKITL